MRRLVEEYGTVLLYIITGIICIVLFTMAFFGDQSSVSNVINSSINNAGDQDISVKYDIVLNADGGDYGNQEVPTTYTKNQQVILPQPTKDGYLFAGWIGTRLTKPTVNVIIPEGSTGNRTYTATWTKGYYRIEFDSNVDYMATKYNGTAYNKIEKAITQSWMSGSTGSMTVEYDKNVSLPNSGFTFKGHIFTGWNTKTDGSGESYSANTTKKDLIQSSSASWAVEKITLYAQWQEVVYNIDYAYTTIDYVYSLQSVSDVENSNPSTYKITDSIVLKPATAEGYESSAWYTVDPYAEFLANLSDVQKAELISEASKDGTTTGKIRYDMALMEDKILAYEQQVDPGSALMGKSVSSIEPAKWVDADPTNLTLYPLWGAKKYIITYNANLPSYVDENAEVKANGASVTVNDNGDIVIRKSGSTYDNTKDIVTKATFASKYTNLVEGYMNGDTFTAVKTRNDNISLLEIGLSGTGTYINPDDDTKSTYKYKFTGWALDDECSKRISASTTVSTAQDHTLYACWEAATYTIKLHSNY